MIANKEDFINYDKFYSKQEVEQLLKSKGFKEGEFKITNLSRALKNYDTELFNNLIRIDKYNNNSTAIFKEFVDTANWGYYKRLLDSNSKSVYSKFVKNYFDKSIDYDKFYTKQELFKILEKKGFNNCRFVFISLRSSLINYNDEVASNVFKKESKDGYLILKEFVDTADWEFLKSLIEAKSANVYYLFFQNHFDKSTDYNKFYTKQEFNQILKNNDFIINNDVKDINYSTFKDCIEKYNKELIDKLFIIGSIGQQHLILKDFVDSIDWDFFKVLYKVKRVKMKFWRIIVENHFEGYIPQNVATAILGYDYRRNKMTNEVAQENNDIFTTIEKDGITKIKTKDVMKWLEFKNSTIRLSEIYQSVVDEIKPKTKYEVDKDFYHRNKLNLINDGFFDKYNPVNPNDTPFRDGYVNIDFYINTKYKNEILEQLKYQLEDKLIQIFGSKKKKFIFRLNQITPTKNKVTLNEFSKFAISRISELSNANTTSYINVLDKLEPLDKEIMLLTTEDVVEIVKSLPTKDAKEEFTRFLNKLRSQRPTKYSHVEYDVEHNKQSINYHIPYTEEQYQRFGFLVLSNSHIWYDGYMEKALAKRRYASVWLYSILHYIGAWRAGDLIDNLPHPDLRMEPEIFLDKVKSKTLTKEEALDIIEQVNMRLKLWNLRPSKTASNTSPNLVMEIPESLYEFAGTLIGICEAHYKLSNARLKRGLITTTATNKEVQEEFFGKEFKEIFGEDAFSNLRAVKNYEIIMSRKSDEKELGTGYMLASIARAHKFKLDKKAETTMVYLKYYKNMEDAEAIVTELFERGVCSFVPYMLTKIVAGEENVLSLTYQERTQKTKEIIGINAFESEMILQGYDAALERSKTKINEIIQSAVCDGLEPKKIAKDILLNLIYNEAPSKQGDISCMLIAQGKKCIYPKRENCVGCGHEIYLKSCLFELGNRINQAKELALNSKTQASKNKNILMIKNVFSPIVAEIFIMLKDVYKIENIDNFKKLIR